MLNSRKYLQKGW